MISGRSDVGIMVVLALDAMPRALSLALPGSGREGSGLVKRQNDNSSSPSDDSGGSSGDGVSLSLGVILPLVIILGIVVLAAIFLIIRHSFPGLLFQGTVQPSLTADSLASATNLPDGTIETRSRSDTGVTRTTANASTVTLQDRGDGEQRRRRGARSGLRRTESGQSIRTLPEYSKDAGDQELVLVRQRPAGSIDAADLEGSEDTPHPETVPLRRAASIGSVTLRSGDAPAEGISDGIDTVISRPGSLALDSAPLLGRLRRNSSSISRRGWGQAPTYLEAMSSPSPTAAEFETGVPPPRAPALRERASTTFRGFLSRAAVAVTFAPSLGRGESQPGSLSTEMRERERERRGDHRFSSQSHLLQPQTSRLSSLASTLGIHSREGSRSPSRSPWASTHSLQISSPVPNTAVRASFDLQGLPRAGLSEDQMRFLSSSEAVNLVGVKIGDVPVNKRRRTSTAIMLGESSGRDAGEDEDEDDPPIWDQVQSAGPVVGGLRVDTERESSPVDPAQIPLPASHSAAPSLEIVPATLIAATDPSPGTQVVL